MFTDILGTCKKEIRLRSQITNQLPLALPSAVEKEFVRLEREGSIYPVEHSDYGTLIVPVIKTVRWHPHLWWFQIYNKNFELKMDLHALPRIDEWFAVLSGGEEFSKIHLTRAYMQDPLYPDSQACTAISTHVRYICFSLYPLWVELCAGKFTKNNGGDFATRFT